MEAYVFPGQGSQRVGMGKDLYDSYAEARAVFQEADAVLGESLSRLCFEGPSEDLKLTRNTQPAILTASVAVWKVLHARGKAPDLVAGHSLGEYSALVAAGSIGFADAVRTVRQRGIFMQEAVPVGQGAMAAVLGLDAQTVREICREAAQGQVVSAANLNADDQIVIAGDAAAVDRACVDARKRGARRAIKLPVSAPFHCALMKPAQARLAPVLEDIEFRDPAIPLVSNVEARLVRSAEEARKGLVEQVSSPVRWTESVRCLVDQGVSRFVEVGPGQVLAGLIRGIVPEVERVSIAGREQVESYV